MKISLCDQTDCLLHSDYVKEKAPHAALEGLEDDPGYYTPPKGMGHAHTINANDFEASNLGVTTLEDFADSIRESFETEAFEIKSKDDLSKLIIKLGKDREIPIECFLCSHRRDVNMKEIIIPPASPLLSWQQ